MHFNVHIHKISAHENIVHNIFWLLSELSKRKRFFIGFVGKIARFIRFIGRNALIKKFGIHNFDIFWKKTVFFKNPN